MIKVIDVKKADIGKYHKPIQDLIDRFSDKSRRNLGLTKDDKKYLTSDQYKYITKRFVMLDGDKLIGFFDILADGKPMYGNITFGIDENYQGKGFGNGLISTANVWIDKHIKEFDNIMWGVLSSNKASIHLAEKYGFKRIKSRDEKRSEGRVFLGYVKSSNLLEHGGVIHSIMDIKLL